MFELTEQELNNWRSQFVTSNSDKMGLRYAPMAFTEQGVAMLSIEKEQHPRTLIGFKKSERKRNLVWHRSACSNASRTGRRAKSRCHNGCVASRNRGSGRAVL